MTTARSYSGSELVRAHLAGKLLWAVLVALLVSTSVLAERQPVHWRHAGAMPPGAIGRQRLMRGGPLSGFCQPVEIRGPVGTRIAPAAGSSFQEGRPSPLLVGLAIGPVYRFRVTEIPGQPGLELFPTVEVVDRLHPPPGEMLRFPIPIELTREELLSAAEGRFITRVIYLEDPLLAVPLDETDRQRWVEARPGEDPLVVADHLGRPMAILRLGGRVPEVNESSPDFLYGAPPVQVYEQPPQPPMMKQALAK
jgi:hypothetical protein